MADLPVTGSIGGMIEWRGVRRDGTGVTGRRETDNVAAFVKARYDAGWKRLVVTLDGAEVGAILAHLDTQQRVWWSA